MRTKGPLTTCPGQLPWAQEPDEPGPGLQSSEPHLQQSALPALSAAALTGPPQWRRDSETPQWRGPTQAHTQALDKVGYLPPFRRMLGSLARTRPFALEV